MSKQGLTAQRPRAPLHVQPAAPDSWHDPFDPFSVATCLAQWGLGIGICVAAGRMLARRLRGEGQTGAGAPDVLD